MLKSQGTLNGYFSPESSACLPIVVDMSLEEMVICRNIEVSSPPGDGKYCFVQLNSFSWSLQMGVYQLSHDQVLIVIQSKDALLRPPFHLRETSGADVSSLWRNSCPRPIGESRASRMRRKCCSKIVSWVLRHVCHKCMSALTTATSIKMLRNNSDF